MSFNPALWLLVAVCALTQIAWVKFICSPTGVKLFSDTPNERSSHTIPTPRGGGTIFPLVILLSLVVASMNSGFAAYPFFLHAIGFVLLGAVSFCDDLYTLSARLRLFCHLFCAALIAWSITRFLIQSETDLQFFLFFFVLTFYGATAINFFNFADGINGYIGALGAWLLIYHLISYVNPSINIFSRPDVMISLALLPALLIFLFFNVIKRKVFMGDVGSTCLGLLVPYLLFAQLSQATTNITAQPSEKIMSVLLLNLLSWWVVWLDCGTMVLAKIMLKFPLSQAHREHLYQRIARKLGSHMKTAAIILCAQVLSLFAFKYFLDLYGQTRAFILLAVVFAFGFTMVLRSNHNALKLLQNKLTAKDYL